jgi:aminoglycoside phosphotransferase (APT) family kinase protein
MTTPGREIVQLLFSSAGLCRRVDDVIGLAGGENSQVLEVRCMAPERTFVLKLYSEALRWKMAKEVFVYGLIDGDPELPISRILFADESGETIPEAYVILTKLPGTLAAPTLSSLPRGDVARIYEQVGAILHRFHQTTFDSFGYLSTDVVEPHDTNAAYMEFQFSKKLREFAELGGDADIRQGAEDAVEASSPVLAGPKQAVLCHNDLHEGNLLLLDRSGSWQVSGVLDLENAVAGDPLLDLAKTDYYAVRGDPVKRRALLEGYGSLPRRAEEAMRLCRLYHAIELWDWFASNRNEEPLPSIAEDIRALSRELAIQDV